MHGVEKVEAHVEHGRRIGKLSADVGFGGMAHFFGMGDDGEQGKSRLKRHPVIAGVFFADFHLVGQAVRTPKSHIGQKESLLLVDFK